MRYMDIRNENRIMNQCRAFFLLMCLCLSGCGKQEEAVWSENVLANVKIGSGREEALAEEIDRNHQRLDENAGNEAAETEMQEPVKVKGIYVTGAIAGTEKMDELIALVEETELNAMVIDIKNDEGAVTYKMQSDMVLEIEAGVRYIRDIEELVEKLHKKDIYLIARIVAFKDPYLAEKKPELSLKTKTGEVFRDKNKEAWVNPYKKEVWDYLMEIGTQAAEAGFDEIQFDYIRFSTDINADNIDYGQEAKTKTKEEVITEFTQYAYDTLHPLGVVVSADVFGTIMDNEKDAEIVGQNYKDMASHLDYICPMVYPSHYSNGAYHIEVPDKEPYETVYQAMNVSKEKLSGTDIAKRLTLGSKEDIKVAGVRTWIQDFTATWLKDYQSYGAAEVRAQIQAVYDAGYEEWILWNARMNYTKEALLPYWEEIPEEEMGQQGEQQEETQELRSEQLQEEEQGQPGQKSQKEEQGQLQQESQEEEQRQLQQEPQEEEQRQLQQKPQEEQQGQLQQEPQEEQQGQLQQEPQEEQQGQT